MAVLARAGRGAKRVARWQRRVWLVETLAGPTVVLALALAATAMARRAGSRRRVAAPPRPA
ncbi:hypothetical protein CIW49_31285 [Mycolicibacterium sp. P1-18]|uniref:hypothetical protein n=1 Tax=Mycolicibacterium sp. P1-18 TaxID=2024615 RepID=UPI0011F269D9|nr:hypothetical protein [Mycolicibacterium sp. P1-18]KAA0090880.1 hypothetical protein CIW49_31285 [Mycolicibacterium sp. P1-18]